MLAALLFVAAAPLAPRADVCSLIGSDLPSFCKCSPVDLGGRLNCTIDVLGQDEIIATADVVPCASPAHVDVNVKEEAEKVNFNYTASLPETENVPIPYLSLDLPGVGKAGGFLDVKLSGSLEDLEVDLSLDVCIDVPIIGKECGGKLPLPDNPFPIAILSGEFDFSSLCARR